MQEEMFKEKELFKEEELAGRGTGLVASCDLHPGLLLLAESPLLVVPWWQRLTQFNRWIIFTTISSFSVICLFFCNFINLAIALIDSNL